MELILERLCFSKPSTPKNNLYKRILNAIPIAESGG
jgi:hypothetical protein